MTPRLCPDPTPSITTLPLAVSQWQGRKRNLVGLSYDAALCEERADDSREDGDDELNDGLNAISVLEHNS